MEEVQEVEVEVEEEEPIFELLRAIYQTEWLLLVAEVEAVILLVIKMAESEVFLLVHHQMMEVVHVLPLALQVVDPKLLEDLAVQVFSMLKAVGSDQVVLLNGVEGEEGEVVVIMEEVEADWVPVVVEDLHIAVNLHANLLRFQLLMIMVTEQ